MTAFKELVEADRARVFLSPDDFGEEHTVDGVLLACVLDTDVRATRAPELGVESGDVRLFAAAEEIGDRREAGDVMDVDAGGHGHGAGVALERALRLLASERRSQP